MVRSKLPMNLRKTISRRALFGSGILFPLALKPGAKPANAEVSFSVGALFSLTGNSADLGTQSKLMMETAAGVVLVGQGSTASSLSIPNDTVFRFVPDDTLESKAIAAAARNEDQGDGSSMARRCRKSGARSFSQELRARPGNHAATGFEYPTAGANFTTVATELAAAVGNLKSNLPLSQIAVFVAGFDEAAGLLSAASASSDLSSVRWFATDGIALSSAFLAPGPAQFAEMTHIAAANLGLPAEAQPLRDPILQAIGLTSPIPFAFAACDAFVCATLAWLLAGEESTKVRDTLAPVAKQHFGTTGWTLLNANGDRAIGSFEFFGIVNGSGGPQWTGLFSQQVS